MESELNIFGTEGYCSCLMWLCEFVVTTLTAGYFIHRLKTRCNETSLDEVNTSWPSLLLDELSMYKSDSNKFL